MKQIILVITAFAWTMHTQAQDNSGTITYNELIELNVQLDGEMAAFAAMIPKEQRSQKLLCYTPGATLYKNKKKTEESSHNMDNDGAQVMIKMDMPDEIIYKDLQAGKIFEQKEFMGRQFLVEGDVKKYKWKMTGKQKEIAGYACREATTIRDKDTITAWFTPAIPVSSGPGSLGNLPGMVLEAHIGSRVHITAAKIEAGKVDKAQLAKPKAGKKMSEDEFEKIVKEKTAEMQQENGGNGNRIIIRKEIH